MKNIPVMISSAILTTVLAVTSVSVYATTPDDKMYEGHGKSHDADGHHNKSKHHHKMKHHFKKLSKRLDLSNEQQAQIKAIYAVHKENKESNKKSMIAFRDKVKNLMMSSTFDEEAFLKLHNQQQSQFSQMALARAKSKHAVLQVLNEEQQEKMLVMKGKRKGHHLRGLF